MIWKYILETYTEGQENVRVLERVLGKKLQIGRDDSMIPTLRGNNLCFPSQLTAISREHGVIGQEGNHLVYTHLSKSGAMTWAVDERRVGIDQHRVCQPVQLYNEGLVLVLNQGESLYFGGDAASSFFKSAFTFTHFERESGQTGYRLTFSDGMDLCRTYAEQDLQYVVTRMAEVRVDKALNDCIEGAGWICAEKPRAYSLGTTVHRGGVPFDSGNPRSVLGHLTVQEKILNSFLQDGFVDPKMLGVDHPDEFGNGNYVFFRPAEYIIQCAYEHPSVRVRKRS